MTLPIILPKNVEHHLQVELGRCSKTRGFHYELISIKKLKYTNMLELKFKHHLYNIIVVALYNPMSDKIESVVAVTPEREIEVKNVPEDFKKQVRCIMEVINTSTLRELIESHCETLIEFINYKAKKLFLTLYGSTH